MNLRVNSFLRISILTLLIFVVESLYGQRTRVRGKVVDADTKEPIPLVNIVFKGTQMGTTSNWDGFFKLETETPTDALTFMYLGYKTKEVKVRKGQFQNLTVELKSDGVKLDEVVFEYKYKRMKNRDNPAIRILNKTIDNKHKYNKSKLKSYQYEVYNKMQLDMNNITEKFQNRRVFKPFKFIFEYMDTSVVTGKNFLPVFITETLSDYYYRRNPKSSKEVIKATKVSGIENESVQQFLGNIYSDIDIYKGGYIELLGRGFINPVSSVGKLYYRYFLVDSLKVDNRRCYKITFMPKNKSELTFSGNMFIADTVFAVRKIQMTLDKSVNINLLNNLDITQEFEDVGKNVWMITKDVVIADFNIFEDPKKTMGFFGRKTTTYRNHMIDTLTNTKVFRNKVTNVIVRPDAMKQTSAYWNKSRHEELNKKELQIYHMVDTIKSLPAFKTYYDIIETAITGHYATKYFEFGPYFKTYSFNDREGNRFRLGGRTTYSLSTKFRPEGYVAYGTKDEEFKFGVGATYIMKTLPRRSISAFYKDDLEQLGQSERAFSEDNILSSVFRRGNTTKLSPVKEVKLEYEHEWFNGFTNSIILKHRNQYPFQNGSFDINENGNTYNLSSIKSTEVTLYTRFAYNEKFIMGKFDRISLGTKYPIFNMFYTHGFKGAMGSDFSYDKLRLNVRYRLNMYPAGYSRFLLEGAKIWGNLPYPLLKLHEGNETFIFDMYSFNMMNYYEFVSDQYVSLIYIHHFNGFFLNKFPLLKRLKWRELVWWKGVMGSVKDSNVAMMKLPVDDKGNPTMFSFDRDNNGEYKPYMEAGIGVENIFKLLRIDAIWRLTYLDNPDISKFGIRASLQIKF